MSDERRIEMRVERRDGRTFLVSPAVGMFTCARFPGEVLVEGQQAGALDCLGVPYTLFVPSGITGRIVSPPPERVHEPVGFGSELYELIPVSDASGTDGAATESSDTEIDLAVLAPYSGRFWHRPSPGDPAFLEVGDVISPGHKLGLIEVMKTFTHLSYEPGAKLPAKARVVRILIDDGGEVSADEPLIAIESV